MNARSALFDLYGDHLRTRGGQAPIAALIQLLGALNIAAPAVRTAVSRMVRQGWLEPVRMRDTPGAAERHGYALTQRATTRLDEAARRIYRHDPSPWDGEWHLLVIPRVRQRAQRERLRTNLAYLGYAALGESSWISPRAAPELDALLTAEELRGERFSAAYDGDARGLVARTWDLEGLGRAYERWLAEARDLLAQRPSEAEEQAFALRSQLVHEWRKFLFQDPGLPAELLPEDWPGAAAARFFDAAAARLLPAASAFVDRCLQTRPG